MDIRKKAQTTQDTTHRPYEAPPKKTALAQTVFNKHSPQIFIESEKAAGLDDLLYYYLCLWIVNLVHEWSMNN